MQVYYRNYYRCGVAETASADSSERVTLLSELDLEEKESRPISKHQRIRLHIHSGFRTVPTLHRSQRASILPRWGLLRAAPPMLMNMNDAGNLRPLRSLLVQQCCPQRARATTGTTAPHAAALLAA
jgi:hypothetical protein